MLSSPNSTHLERWLGAEALARLQRDMQGWYGPPIAISDVPGEVMIAKDGDFVGRMAADKIPGGQYFSALDVIRDTEIKRRKAKGRLLGRRSKQSGMAGFTSLSDLISEATVSGKMQPLQGNIQKIGTAGQAVATTNSLWRVTVTPGAGAAAGAAPGGTVPTSATTGAFQFANPPGGDLQYVIGGDIAATVATNSLLLYARTFAVAINPNTTGAQAITGVPTLYQNATAGQPDSIVGNFAFMEVGTALAATAHNFTMTYQDQANNAAEAAPVTTGVLSAVINRLDHAGWFIPLNATDSGIRNATNVTMSAAVATGAMDLVIGHPVSWFAFPLANIMTPFDFVFQRMAPGRIFDSACLALLEVGKGSTTATTYTGTIWAAWG
jgi:hypothetical protein